MSGSRRFGFVLSCSLLVGLAASPAPGQDSADVTLTPGETTEAVTRTGIAGGTRHAEEIGEGATETGTCAGFIAESPNHTLHLTQDFEQLSVAVQSNGDCTLVIRGPAGVRCNDDSVGLNPVVTGPWQAGTYEIYVGDYDGAASPYTVYFTESPVDRIYHPEGEPD